MSEKRWTEGEWRYDTYNTIWAGDGERAKQICLIPDHPKGDEYYLPEQIAERSAWYAESAANASLIAAAPELYEALEELRNELRGLNISATCDYLAGLGMACDKADVALARARGEA